MRKSLETIHFYHTNDVHSHFEYWPRIHDYLIERKKFHLDAGESCFIFDIGDHIDRSTIYTEATLGKGNVELLNKAQFDAVTIGNNEGITLSHDDLMNLYENANFDVIVANLESFNSETPSWIQPYQLYTTKFGTKIGVIGVTAAFTAFYKQLGWHVSEPREIVKKMATELRGQVDILVCLSHLGIQEDELLASECEELDVIFGAHTHHVLPEGKFVHKSLLTGAGKYGAYVGHVEVTVNELGNRVSKIARLVDTKDLPAVPYEQQFVFNLKEKGKNLLQEPLFYVDQPLNKEWYHHSQLSRFFAACLLDYTKADCAMFNAGIFLTGLPKGNVTAYDIHRMLPHPINPCVVELTGSEIKEALLQANNDELPRLELKGLGFRGYVLGKILNYQCYLDSDRQLFIQNQLADLHTTYKLATLDMFTFGYFFPSFQRAKKEYFMPGFLRDLLIQYGKQKFRKT